MLKFIWLLNNILLIVLILIRTPNNSGLESFATKSNFLGSPNSAENFLKKLNELIELNLYNSNYTVEDLAKSLSISRVQLYRKVKAILGISISEHINNIRLEKSKELLLKSKQNISEIAYAVGFSSPYYFSNVFKNKFGNVFFSK